MYYVVFDVYLMFVLLIDFFCEFDLLFVDLLVDFVGM